MKYAKCGVVPEFFLIVEIFLFHALYFPQLYRRKILPPGQKLPLFTQGWR